MTSAITAPLAAAYAAGGALGWGADLKSGRIRLLWGFVLLTGMFCGIFLGASPYQIILLAQAGNGVVLPLALILLLVVVNRTAIMGKYRNSARRQRPRNPGGGGDLGARAGPSSPGSSDSRASGTGKGPPASRPASRPRGREMRCSPDRDGSSTLGYRY